MRIRVESHPLFQRDGDDLHIAIPVSVVVAALGGHVEAPNIAGGRIKIAIPPETQSGRVLRLRGRGLANPRHGGCGDMLCQVIVETPVNLTGEQRKILQRFDKYQRPMLCIRQKKNRGWKRPKDCLAIDTLGKVCSILGGS